MDLGSHSQIVNTNSQIKSNSVVYNIYLPHNTRDAFLQLLINFEISRLRSDYSSQEQHQYIKVINKTTYTG